ncbi:MAG: ABC transporter permease [Planctomycetota bacterium]
MTGAGAAFRAELSDLAKHPLVWLGVGGTVAAGWGASGFLDADANAYLRFEIAARFGAGVAAFFLMTLAALSVAADRTRGTTRWVFARPVSRTGIVLGKAGALALFTVLFFGVCVTTAYAIGAPAGFTDIRPGEEALSGFEFGDDAPIEEEFQAATMRRNMWEAAWMLLPALLTVTGLGLAVSCLLRSSAGAVIVGLAMLPPVYFLAEVMGVAERHAHLLPFRAARHLLSQLEVFAEGYSTGDWPEYGVGAWLVASLVALGLPVAGALIFSRLDLTE